jgi:adenosylcobinamide-GDP ribazoletransferase
LGLLRGLKNSIAFMTIFPVGMDRDGIAQAASYMPIFPLIGAGEGLVAGAVARFVELFLPPLVAGMIGLSCLILVNGVQHADGLLDFGDGVMFHGSPREKLRVMDDPTTGAGGLSLGLIVLSTTAFAIAALPPGLIIAALMASETAAKFSMIFATATSKSAHKGMNTVFVEAMHTRRGLRLSLSFVILAAVSLLALGTAGLRVAIGAVLTGAVMVVVSKHHFGGITGDVMGATNEISRVISLLLVLVSLK